MLPPAAEPGVRPRPSSTIAVAPEPVLSRSHRAAHGRGKGPGEPPKAAEPPRSDKAKAPAARVTDSVIADKIDPLEDDLADVPPIPAARIAAALRADAAKAARPR